MADKIRLNSYIAKCGICSRREADTIISDGRVSVNGKTVSELGVKVDPKRDRVSVDEKQISLPGGNSYYILNKPREVVTTIKDPQGRRTVNYYIRQTGKRLYPVGRLDYYSEGLLILTDDGELAHRIQHPRYRIEKEYLVEIDSPLSASELAEAQRGVKLDDGFIKPVSFNVEEGRGETAVYRIVISEGRKRILRRVFEYFQRKVRRLARVSVAGINLGDLEPGTFRELTQEEIGKLKKITNLA
ncbi:MAG: pseudouridine synthase [candidate division Zixibacteria bacterium]|nr:pseudouridine synthase [candidate division Zixibacteria bacterium]